jgi:hypothetical protein
MRRDSIRHEFVEFIPDAQQMEDGVVYVSIPYNTVAHRCCCGCGSEVNNAISPTDYELSYNGDTITLYPSIGNWSFPCRSHYYLRENRVIWLPAMSQAKIDAGRAEDRRRKAAYFQQVNAPSGFAEPVKPERYGIWRRLWRRLLGGGP